jgi:hypothetical protein
MAGSVSVAREREYVEIYENLKRVSHEALASAKAPTPMIVGSPSTPLGNDVDPNQKTWYVADGICGFAHVYISGRSGFAKWLVATGRGYKQYGGGVAIRDHARDGFAQTRQSYELKCQVAGAMANYLRGLKFDANVWSRID